MGRAPRWVRQACDRSRCSCVRPAAGGARRGATSAAAAVRPGARRRACMPYRRPQYSASLLVVPNGSAPPPLSTWRRGGEGGGGRGIGARTLVGAGRLGKGALRVLGAQVASRARWHKEPRTPPLCCAAHRLSAWLCRNDCTAAPATPCRPPARGCVPPKGAHQCVVVLAHDRKAVGRAPGVAARRAVILLRPGEVGGLGVGGLGSGSWTAASCGAVDCSARTGSGGEAGRCGRQRTARLLRRPLQAAAPPSGTASGRRAPTSGAQRRRAAAAGARLAQERVLER